jgi:hypothetical protein
MEYTDINCKNGVYNYLRKNPKISPMDYDKIIHNFVFKILERKDKLTFIQRSILIQEHFNKFINYVYHWKDQIK